MGLTMLSARHRRLGALILLGLASGLPFELTSGTLQLWLADGGLDSRILALFPHLPRVPHPDHFVIGAGVTTLDFTAMGLFSLLGLPYVLKPLWSPFVDRFLPPGLGRFGRRRAWMLLCQLGLVVGLLAMSTGSPAQAPWVLAAVALGVAFFSATQDIAVDAYRTDVLPPRERGLGAALASSGYRGGMLAAGAICPIVATAAGWDIAYVAMAALMSLGLVATLFSPREPATAAPASMRAAVRDPLRDLFSREHIWGLLALVLLYKLGDAFGSSLFSAFLRRGLDFSPAEVGAVRKTVGVLAVFAGMFIGGILMLRLTLSRALLAFGILQAVTNLAFVALAASDKSLTSLVIAIAGENIATGLGSVAFVAFLTALCDARFSATQYALLSALAALGRVLIGPVAGPTADAFGWQGFFWISTLIALPGVWLVWRRRGILDALGQRPPVQPAP